MEYYLNGKSHFPKITNTQNLSKLVKRSYKLDAEYTSDAEANFVFDFIEHCADEELRKALIDLDEFLIGYY